MTCLTHGWFLPPLAAALFVRPMAQNMVNDLVPPFASKKPGHSSKTFFFHFDTQLSSLSPEIVSCHLTMFARVTAKV
jgi:hypothetical protein